MTKKEIIEGIHILVSNNVIGEKQLMSRYKGFKGELHYDEYHKMEFPELKVLQGGTIVSIDNKESSLNNAFYYSLIPKTETTNVNDYEAIYKKLSNLGFVKMFLIIYPENTKEFKIEPVMKYETGDVSLAVPDMEILFFNSTNSTFENTSNSPDEITDLLSYHKKRGRNSYPIPLSSKNWLIDNLSQFSEEELLQIYMDRLFLDGFIGFAANKGKISDIDLITKKDDAYRLIEIKEKDLPKRAKKGFWS